MNRAEYIVKTINDANNVDIISQRESVRVLSLVASMLNSGMESNEIDNSPTMTRLWKEVHKRWGKQL